MKALSPTFIPHTSYGLAILSQHHFNDTIKANKAVFNYGVKGLRRGAVSAPVMVSVGLNTYNDMKGNNSIK